MNQAVNFYELKTQLADLGYTDPRIVDQLRSIISDAPIEYTAAIVHARQEGINFELELARNEQDDFELLFNHAWTVAGQKDLFGYFKMDIPAAQIIKQLKLNIMNTENLSYLHKQLLNLGFGEKLNKELEEKIEAKTPEFTLNTTNTYNKQNVDYTLHYKAGEQHEMYFFNKFDAKVNDQQQTFYINKGESITAKEAFNLIEGRAVYKEMQNKNEEKYHAWVLLDKENKHENGNYKTKTFTDAWNFKPEKAIDKMDIVGINDAGARDQLLRSLEKGNRHQVTAIKNGKEVQLFIETNPADHRLNLTNYKGEPQKLEDYKKAEFKRDKQQDKTQQQQETQEGTKKKSQQKLRAA